MNENEVFLPPYVVNEINPVLPQSQTIDWGTQTLNIPELHELGLTGKGVKVAIVDTGIDDQHPDLVGAILKLYNTTTEAFAFTHGHGIGCAGIIGGNNNETGILGTAYDCQILGIKSMRENGGGAISEIVAGIDMAVSEGAQIINLSLGTTGDVPVLKQAVKRATDKGIYVVCSAGNAGQDNSVVYPARYEETYAVGATNVKNEVSAFSSRGWEVDIAAPGERVLTSWKNRTYARVSGTSFSAPYVSGLFALFIQAGIMITHDRLKATAIDIEEPGQDEKSGHGLIDPIQFVEQFIEVPSDPPTDPPNDPSENTGCLGSEKIVAAHKLLGEYLGLNKK
jgi:subtilisin family serine protease